MEIYSIYVNRPNSKFKPNFSQCIHEDMYFTDLSRIEVSLNQVTRNPSREGLPSPANEHTSIPVRNHRRGRLSYDEINYSRYNFSHILNHSKTRFCRNKTIKIIVGLLFASICISFFIVGLFLTLKHSNAITASPKNYGEVQKIERFTTSTKNTTAKIERTVTRGALENTTSDSNYVGSTDKCIEYNGIVHPKNQTKCCASTCRDLCGALNCDEADGGASACCGSGIQENVICGLNGQKAPCSLNTICFTKGNHTCVFPFKYGDDYHGRCIKGHGGYWCPYSITVDENYDDWDWCIEDNCTEK